MKKSLPFMRTIMFDIMKQRMVRIPHKRFYDKAVGSGRVCNVLSASGASDFSFKQLKQGFDLKARPEIFLHCPKFPFLIGAGKTALRQDFFFFKQYKI